MQLLVVVLAVFGFMGAARLMGRALLRLMSRGVEAYLASEASRTHARRGDITSLEASDAIQTVARRARFRAGAVFAGSVALLAIPVFTPWTAILYACYLPLWFARPRPIPG